MNSGPAFPPHPDALRWWARIAPQRVALVDRARDQRFTYAELDAMSDAWCSQLVLLGIRRGDHVATLAGNRAAQPALLYACIRLGAALVPLNWRLAPPELSRIVANARPRVMIGESRFRQLAEQSGVAGAGSTWHELRNDGDFPQLVGGAGRHQADVVAQADDAVLVLYTSGSTGAPKGAVIPHRQLLYNAIATTAAWELGAADIAPVSTPFFHTGGWNVFATPLWHCGGRIILFDQFEPSDFLEGLAAEGCTVALTVPTQMTMMLESRAWGLPLPSLRWFISGGAPCPQAVLQRVRASGYRMKEGFGLTECGPNCFAITLDEAERRPGSVGWPVPFLQMRLTDDDGSEVVAGDVGELLLRGPQMFGGYLDDPVATARAVDGDGWLHTGDLASRDDDGAYRIRGRRKEMFISGAENVYPGEVEAAIAEHPAVVEVAVIGLPDEKWGEVGRAFVVPRAGRACEPNEIVAFARSRLAGYKVPKSVVIVPALPRLGSGKIDRNALARTATSERTP
jgi:fatty-acyl-CoA synthase